MPLARFTFRGRTFLYKEEAEGSAFHFNKGIGNGRITCTYRVPWRQRVEASDALLGETTFVPITGQTFGYFHRLLPHGHPEGVPEHGLESGMFSGPFNTWLWCKQADYGGQIRATTVEDGIPGHLYALINCTYEGLPYQSMLDSQMGGTEFDTSIVPVDEATLKRFVSHPTPEDKSRLKIDAAGRWKFSDNGRAFTSAMFTKLVEESHIFTWHQCIKVNLPYPSIAACKLGCNHEAFAGFPAETLVFAKYAVRDLPRLQLGTLGVDMNYHMEHYPQGANNFPDPRRTPGTFYPVIANDGSGRKPYPPVNFRTLFRPIPAPAGVVI